MLYELHELTHAAIAPWRLAAEANQFIFRHYLNPLAYTHGGRAVAAALELFESNVRPYRKPAFGLNTTKIDGKDVAVAERVVARRPFCQLKHFRRDVRRDDPRVLMVAPLSGHYATLLRGTVEAMLPDHEVYITDWRDARRVPLSEGPFHLDDYIDYIVDFLHQLGPDTHVMAVCQPAVPALAAAALMSVWGDNCAPATLTLMGGPIDTRINPTVPNKLAKSHSIESFERSVIGRVPVTWPGFMRRVYPGFLQLSGFMSMNLDRHVGAHLRMFQHLVQGDGDSAAAHRKFYDEYRAVMDLPAEYYLETVERVFQRHDLAVGDFTHRDEPVEPAAIRKTALLTVEGEKDDISGVGQTKAAHDICSNIPSSRREHYEQEGVGHYGVFNGKRWREEIAPRVKAFIRKHG
jgi:poly(3-hydroxybutyrate) depolymerase